MAKFRPSLSLLCAGFALAGCSEDPAAPPEQEVRIPASIALATDSLGMYPGDVFDLTPVVLDTAGEAIEDAAITWTIADPAVVAVDSSGMLTARAHGITRVIGAADAHADTVLVRVTRFVQVVGKESSALCARDVEGRGWCMGYDVSVPADSEFVGHSFLHPMHLDFAFSTLTVGSNHACGLAYGLTYCWGYNTLGELGSGSLSYSRALQTVAGDHGFVSIAAGSDHTCALDAGGAAWCWGRDQSGQLGDGGETTFESVPVPVAGGHTWRTLDAGNEGTCGLAEDGLTYCWGSINGESEPTPIEDFPADVEHLLTDGVQVCGVILGAKVICHSSPDAATLSSAILADAVVDLATGGDFACAVLDSGVMGCWGTNYHGVFGNGTFEHADEPVLVQASEPIVAATAMYRRVCGLTPNGAILCWGTWVGSLLPARVAAPRP